jgi:hypothetical protein
MKILHYLCVRSNDQGHLLAPIPAFPHDGGRNEVRGFSEQEEEINLAERPLDLDRLVAQARSAAYSLELPFPG